MSLLPTLYRYPTILLFIAASSVTVTAQKKKSDLNYIVRGSVMESLTGEPIIGATVYLPELKRGTTTNELGEYRIWLRSGIHTLDISSIGFSPLRIELNVGQDTIIRHAMDMQVSSLDEVVVHGESDPIRNLALGQNRLDLTTLKKIPPLLGEPDIIRALVLLPGITTVGEGATGFNVRGGSVDQNLILVDDAPLFNLSHLFGFLTAFNSGTVQNADIYKASIPANFGGRAASVLDIKLKQGNARKISTSAGIGLMSGSLTVDGPIIKERTTFLVSARTSYADWLLKTIPEDEIKNSDASFHDIVIKLSHRFNENHQLSFTGYRSHDSFKFPGDTTYGWNTQNFTLKLGSSITNKLFVITTLVSSDYKYEVNSRSQTNEADWNAGINFLGFKSDAMLTADEKNKTDFGIGAERYKVGLGTLIPVNNSNVNPFEPDPENALILYAYVSHQLDIHEKLSLRFGLRGSSYQLYGPRTINRYQDNQPRNELSYVGADEYKAGQNIQNYSSLEPRVTVRYALSASSSIKAGYDRTVQFLHLISNTSAVSPVDIWKLSDPYLKPQQGNQFSAGYFRAIANFNLSAEVFYKSVRNVVDYKDGAEMLLNEKLEADLLQGKGRSYGIEWMAEKKQGKLTGWLSYTLSRTERKIDGEFKEEAVSKGEYYPASYDKTHNVSLTTSYRTSQRISWGLNFIFASGRPITYPSSSYNFGGVRIANFEFRNNERTPSYHRLDLSLEIRSREKPTRKWRGTWIASLYNVYARKNPYSIFFRSDFGVRAQSYRLAVIGTIIPSLSYNISF